MTTTTRSVSEQWLNAIEAACAEPDAARCNRRITELHFSLSEALANALGRDAGPNFHTWAVWGSRKAGVTIRQEDLDTAIHDATWTAGCVGLCVGITSGILLGLRFPLLAELAPHYLTGLVGAAFGAPAGAWAGKRIAIWSRRKAAQLILEGNQTVLKDIGKQSARFLQLLSDGATPEERLAFFAGLRPGPTEQLGQDRLAKAFRSWLSAFDSSDLKVRREAMIVANCEIVHHEHIRLEPYIRGAMPFIIQRCATQRLMTYEIGDQILAVAEDLPGVPAPTAAHNWTRIEERMRYVFALFRKYHNDPKVFSTPYPDSESSSIPGSQL
jgi:hypothetical protein